MPQIYSSGGLVQLHFTEFSLIILKKQNNRLKNEQLDDPSSVRIDGECSQLILMQYLCTVSIQNGAFSGPFNTTAPETTGSVPWYLHSWPIRCIIVSEMYHTAIPR